MKKTALLIVFLAALVFAGAVIYTLSRRALPDPAFLLPETTRLYITFPDLQRTTYRWSESTLASMSRDPSIRPFLARPIARLLENPDFFAAAEVLAPLRLRQLFLAGWEDENSTPVILIGFRNDGTEESARSALGQMHQYVAEAFGQKTELEERELAGFLLQVQTMDGQIMVSTLADGWGLISNNVDAVQSFLEKAAGSASAVSVLASNPNYLEAIAALGRDPDLFCFLHVPPLVSAFRSFAESQGETIIPSHYAQLEKFRVLGFAAQLEKGRVIERKLALGDWEILTSALTNAALAFAPENTLFYASSRWNPEDISADLLSDYTGAPLLQILSEAGVDPENINHLLGPEIGMFLWWPTAALLPSIVLTAEMTDPELTRKVAGNLVGLYAGEAIVTEGEEMTTMTFSGFGAGIMISPTLGFQDKQVFLSMNPVDLTTALEAKQSGGNFAKSPTMDSVRPLLQQHNFQFAVLDLPGLIRRSYLTLQPVLGFAAAMSPDIANYVNLNLLPSAEEVSRHLGPVVTTQRAVQGGFLVEVQGPATFSPLVLGAAVGAREGFSTLQEMAE